MIQKIERPTSILHLPNDIIGYLFTFFGPVDLAHMKRVSKKFKKFSEEQIFWKEGMRGLGPTEYSKRYSNIIQMLTRHKLPISLILDNNKIPNLLKMNKGEFDYHYFPISIPYKGEEYNCMVDQPLSKVKEKLKPIVVIDITEINLLKVILNNLFMAKKHLSSLVFVVNPPDKDFEYTPHVYSIKLNIEDKKEILFNQIVETLVNFKNDSGNTKSLTPKRSACQIS